MKLWALPFKGVRSADSLVAALVKVAISRRGPTGERRSIEVSCETIETRRIDCPKNLWCITKTPRLWTGEGAQITLDYNKYLKLIFQSKIRL